MSKQTSRDQRGEEGRAMELTNGSTVRDGGKKEQLAEEQELCAGHSKQQFELSFSQAVGG